MQYPGLDVERRDGVEVVTLDRGAAFNALDRTLIGSLSAYFERLQDAADVRVVLLRANGRHFCAGVDLKGWSGEIVEPTIAASLAMQRSIVRIVRMMRSCPQPIIALGHGVAAGAAFR